MGSCFSMSAEEAEANRRTRKLEKMMQEQARIESETVKLLILGAGESGKSTLFKQMKILYGAEATKSERKGMINVIHCNVIQSMQIMLGQIDHFEENHHLNISATGDEQKLQDIVIAFKKKASKEAAGRIKKLRQYDTLTSAIVLDLQLLWATEAVQSVYALRHTYQLPDSTSFYMTKLDELIDPAYSPSKEDMLRARVRTSGIVEEKYVIDGVKFSIYDVGGQRNERKKWIHCFEDVTAIIFVAAISEYDQVLFEDHTQNRVVEALELFKEICSSAWFTKTSIVLFLNKVDLFKEKIKVRKIEDNPYFSDCNAGHSLDEGVRYMTNKFLDQVESKRRKNMYAHATCATDTNNVKFVFGSCLSIITSQNLSSAGFM